MAITTSRKKRALSAFAAVLFVVTVGLGFRVRALPKDGGQGLVCEGERGHAKDARQARQNATEDELYLFAQKTFGAPVSCRMSFSEYDSQIFASVWFEFEGATYSSESSPPEVNMTRVMVRAPFADPKGAEAVLRKTGWPIDWAKPKVSAPDAEGLITKTFWSSDGDNLGVDLIYKAGRLVGIGRHLAV